MKGFDVYKEYFKMKIVLIILIILTLYNGINYLIGKRDISNSSPLNKFIQNNTDNKLNYNSRYNLFFIITPVDCQCLDYIITKDFLENIKSICKDKNKNISISYIVSGDFKMNELKEYIFPIKDDINYYIDKNNKAKAFIFRNFKTYRTPLVLILDDNGTIKYWQIFSSDVNSNEIFYNFFKLLEAIE